MSAMERFFFGEFYRLEGKRLKEYWTVGISQYFIDKENEEIIFFWSRRTKWWKFWVPNRAIFVGRFKRGANDAVVSREVDYGAALRSQKFPSREEFIASASNNSPAVGQLLEKIGGDLDRLSYLRLNDWFGEPPGQGQG